MEWGWATLLTSMGQLRTALPQSKVREGCCLPSSFPLVNPREDLCTDPLELEKGPSGEIQQPPWAVLGSTLCVGDLDVSSYLWNQCSSTPSPVLPVFPIPAQTTFIKYLFCARNSSKSVHLWFFFSTFI